MIRIMLFALLAVFAVVGATACGATEHHDNLLALQAEFDEYKELQSTDRQRKNEALAYAAAELRQMRRRGADVDEILARLERELEADAAASPVASTATPFGGR